MNQSLAIINPAAGAGRCGREVVAAIAALKERGVTTEVWYTREAGHASALAQQGYEQGFRNFIAIGGDGTAFEIINGFGPAFGKRGAERVRLGFLPLGTGNSFIRDAGVLTMDQALTRLAAGRSRPCDVVRVTHAQGVVYSLNILSFGFVAEVCRLTEQRFKALGHAGYGLAVLAKLGRLRPLSLGLRIDGGETWEQPLLVASINNSQFTGGNMPIAPFADFADGKLDLLLVKPVNPLTFLRLFAKMFTGKHVHQPQVTTAQASRLTCRFPGPIDAMIDGEVMQLDVHEISVVPAALDVSL